MEQGAPETCKEKMSCVASGWGLEGQWQLSPPLHGPIGICFSLVSSTSSTLRTPCRPQAGGGWTQCTLRLLLSGPRFITGTKYKCALAW